MSDRVIVFNKGVVQQIDTPINIYKNPANEFVADFIGKISFVHGKINGDYIEIDNGQKINYSGNKKSSGPVIAAVRPESVTVF